MKLTSLKTTIRYRSGAKIFLCTALILLIISIKLFYSDKDEVASIIGVFGIVLGLIGGHFLGKSGLVAPKMKAINPKVYSLKQFFKTYFGRGLIIGLVFAFVTRYSSPVGKEHFLVNIIFSMILFEMASLIFSYIYLYQRKNKQK